MESNALLFLFIVSDARMAVAAVVTVTQITCDQTPRSAERQEATQIERGVTQHLQSQLMNVNKLKPH